MTSDFAKQPGNVALAAADAAGDSDDGFAANTSGLPYADLRGTTSDNAIQFPEDPAAADLSVAGDALLPARRSSPLRSISPPPRSSDSTSMPIGRMSSRSIGGSAHVEQQPEVGGAIYRELRIALSLESSMSE